MSQIPNQPYVPGPNGMMPPQAVKPKKQKMPGMITLIVSIVLLAMAMLGFMILMVRVMVQYQHGLSRLFSSGIGTYILVNMGKYLLYSGAALMAALTFLFRRMGKTVMAVIPAVLYGFAGASAQVLSVLNVYFGRMGRMPKNFAIFSRLFTTWDIVMLVAFVLTACLLIFYALNGGKKLNLVPMIGVILVQGTVACGSIWNGFAPIFRWIAEAGFSDRVLNTLVTSGLDMILGGLAQMMMAIGVIVGVMVTAKSVAKAKTPAAMPMPRQQMPQQMHAQPVPQPVPLAKPAPQPVQVAGLEQDEPTNEPVAMPVQVAGLKQDEPTNEPVAMPVQVAGLEQDAPTNEPD